MSALLQADQVAHFTSQTNAVVLDCRSDLGNPENAVQLYQQGHIAGAIHAHLENDLSGEIILGTTGRHPLPTPDQWQATLRRWGIDEQSKILLYDQNNSMFAVRAWWMLQWAGITQVSILDGGLDAYLAIGGSLSTESSSRTPSQLTISVRDDQVASADDLMNLQANQRLLDARALPRYEGKVEPLHNKAGHIPGAWNLDFSHNLQANKQFLPKQALVKRFAPVRDNEVICYCGSGVTACHNIFAMTEAGLPMPKLYPGSWSEWITDDQRSIATDIEGDVL